MPTSSTRLPCAAEPINAASADRRGPPGVVGMRPILRLFEPEVATPPHLPYANAMRVLASVAVIAIHSQIRFAPDLASPAAVGTAAFFNTSTRWCVPTFFMLSGALLLQPCRREPARAFFARRLSRLGVPLLFWSIAFVASWQARPRMRRPTGEWLDRVAFSFARGTPYYHLWFAFALLGLYAITPALRAGRRALSPAEWRRGAIFCLALASATSVIWPLMGHTEFWLPPTPNVLTDWLPYLGYFAIGPIVAAWRPTARQLAIAAATFVGCAAIGASGWYVAHGTSRAQAGAALSAGYLAPHVIVMSLAAFALVAAAFRAPPRGLAWIGHPRLAEATLCVYLMHPFVVEQSYRVARVLRLDGTSSPVHVTGCVAIAVVGSFAIAIALRAIPGARRIVG